MCGLSIPSSQPCRNALPRPLPGLQGQHPAGQPCSRAAPEVMGEFPAHHCSHTALSVPAHVLRSLVSFCLYSSSITSPPPQTLPSLWERSCPTPASLHYSHWDEQTPTQLSPKLGPVPAHPSTGFLDTRYLPIAISLQRLIRRVSVIGLVGNEVRTLHFIDGFNLGKSCQVFVIKDLIIHFSLGRGRDGDREAERKRRREGKGGWSAQCGASTGQTEPTVTPAAGTGKRRGLRGSSGEGRGAGRAGLCPSERS